MITTSVKLEDTQDQPKSREMVATATGEKEEGAEFNSQVEKILMRHLPCGDQGHLGGGVLGHDGHTGGGGQEADLWSYQRS